jgi:coenzyme F420-dependent glucose-6-phosphate dehydrogenase
MRVGIKLCAEERSANELVQDAVAAEEAGFDFAAVSDHFHPWVDAQGESPFVWSVLGGVAVATERIEVGTAVTCPTIRTHPVIVAQAAATVASMLPRRFFLGVGTGERLNEHVTGDHWPRPDARREMLREAVDIMRQLWTGDLVTHRGTHFEVDGARIYSLPEEPPPVMVAAGGESAASLAAEIGDGLIGTSPDADLVSAYRSEAAGGARVYGEVAVCYGDDPEEGLRTALRRWPNAVLPGALSVELALPEHFDSAAQLLDVEHLREAVVTGPDPEPYLERARTYADAGYDGVWFHQIGTDQQPFIDMARKELLPDLTGS